MQNASLMKRIRIAEVEGQDWRRELLKYVTKYRKINHATTGRSPAELLFNRKIRGKLLELQSDHCSDLEVRDRDAEFKAKTEAYADERRNARPSYIQVGDQVLARQEKTDKLSLTCNPTPYQVVSMTGNRVVVESQGGALYSRNSSHVKKFVSEAPPFTPMIPPVASGDSAAAVTSPLPIDSGNGGGTHPTNAEVPSNQVISTRMQTQTPDSVLSLQMPTPGPVESPQMLSFKPAATLIKANSARMSASPQRQRKPPVKYKDFVSE